MVRLALIALLLPTTASAMSPVIIDSGSLALEEDTHDKWYDLAWAYAPIHYQDVDADGAIGDYLTAFDYDGNTIADDNWNNLNDFPRNAVVYWSVAETCTHWYVTYSFFHPRDWYDNYFDGEHENDLEGILLIVERDGSELGNLRGGISVAHTDFYSWTTWDSPLTSGEESVDGTLWTSWDGDHLRPMTAQEAEGHGLYAWGHGRTNFEGEAGQDGAIYYPSQTVSEEPEHGDDRHVSYTLVSTVDTLWSQQLDELDLSEDDADAYYEFGTFKGDDDDSSDWFEDCGDGLTVICQENAANLPWSWDDSDDLFVFESTPPFSGTWHSEMPAGMLGLDPARIVDAYFAGLGEFSDVYSYHPFVRDLRDLGYGETVPRGFDEDLDLSELTGRISSLECLSEGSSSELVMQ